MIPIAIFISPSDLPKPGLKTGPGPLGNAV